MHRPMLPEEGHQRRDDRAPAADHASADALERRLRELAWPEPPAGSRERGWSAVSARLEAPPPRPDDER